MINNGLVVQEIFISGRLVTCKCLSVAITARYTGNEKDRFLKILLQELDRGIKILGVCMTTALFRELAKTSEEVKQYSPLQPLYSPDAQNGYCTPMHHVDNKL